VTVDAKGLDVVAVGELNPDLILDEIAGAPRLGREILAGRCTFTLGSSTALCCANLAALGLSVGIVGKVGADLFGEFVLRSLADRGIDAGRVIRDPSGRTGVTVSLAYPEDRAMVTCPGAMASLAAADVDLDYVATARHLHVSSPFLQPRLQPGLPDLFRSAKARGLTTSLDPGWDPAESWDAGIDALLDRLDILLLNRIEACALGKDRGGGSDGRGRCLRRGIPLRIPFRPAARRVRRLGKRLWGTDRGAAGRERCLRQSGRGGGIHSSEGGSSRLNAMATASRAP
jgi:sugar/nucleoside kinase (ribokinase family)